MKQSIYFYIKMLKKYKKKIMMYDKILYKCQTAGTWKRDISSSYARKKYEGKKR